LKKTNNFEKGQAPAQNPGDPRSDEWSQSLCLVLGKVIEGFREERGKMSQVALAKKAGIHSTALSKIERGKTSPSVTTLYRLAEALGLKPEEILVRCRDLETEMKGMTPKKITPDFVRGVTETTNWLGLLGGVGIAAGIVAAGSAALFASKSKDK
jgi:DNA-binding XRE family transcriptional regulator